MSLTKNRGECTAIRREGKGKPVPVQVSMVERKNKRMPVALFNFVTKEGKFLWAQEEKGKL